MLLQSLKFHDCKAAYRIRINNKLPCAFNLLQSRRTIFLNAVREIVIPLRRSVSLQATARDCYIASIRIRENFTTKCRITKYRRNSCLGNNRSQSAALIKRIITNRSNAIRNCNRNQSTALIKRTLTNRSNAITNCNRSQTAATDKHTITNRSNAIRNCNRNQSTAISVSITDCISRLLMLNGRKDKM